MAIKQKIDPKATVFIGIENGNGLIIRERLDDLLEIPYLSDIIIKREFHHEAPNNYKNGNLPYYYYKIIDRAGVRSTIKLDNFEITEIEPEVNYYGRLDHRNVKVYDKQDNVYRTFVSKANGENFIVEEFLPLIKTLRFIPNWDIMIEYLEIPKLKKRIASLEEELQSLKDQLKDGKQE